ncbi:FAD-binding oxidoreductase [Secundilactobacillus hailunensis]|uniref:FAD-binding oxidoreductase n=1 Tax=Secundilactobacillus hailunensis TaxID=2559923 RepID=A0ABW1T859_9LACO|nr:FAD-dependent oxidoreductase [Secundilactobacillus hailunensis]
MLKRFPKILSFVWVIVLFILPLPLVLTLATGLSDQFTSEGLAVQAGSIAYVWFLIAIYLATRPHWLDRLIGLPSVYMVHGCLSILAIILAFLHKTGTHSGGLIKTTGDLALYLFIGLMAYSLVFMVGWLTSRIPVLNQLKHWLEQTFKHEFSVWLHRLNLIAVALVFIHVQLIGYITAIHPYMWWFNGYTAVVALTYVYAKLRDTWWLSHGKLVNKRKLAPNFFEFTFSLKKHHQLTVKPGDYVFISFPDYAGLHELHPFSVVNAVHDDQLVLAIRGDGDFTRAIQDLPLHAVAHLTGGFGLFNNMIANHPAKPLVLVAGGSGVVPMLALIQAYPQLPINLYYSAHRPTDLIYVPQLKALAASRSTLTVHIQTGRFDVASAVTTTVTTPALYLLSGPAHMGQAWQHALLQAGVAHDNMYYEQFSW